MGSFRPPRVLRRLLRSPGFTSVAVFTMALGIGATTAIFSVVKGVLLEPLPYPDSDRLVTFSLDASKRDIPELPLSDRGFFHFRDKNETFEAVGVYRGAQINITGDEQPERLNIIGFSKEVLEVLGVSPMMGRRFTPEEDLPNAPRVALISSGLWNRRFGADPDILGRTILLNGRAVEIIGVMGPDFRFPNAETEIWTALRLNPESANFGGHSLTPVARLKPGLAVAAALGDVERLIARFEEAGYTPMWFNDVFTGRATVRTLKEEEVGDVRRALLIVFGTVGFVLIIACTNVANLMLVRAENQQREVAVRTALGASRRTVIGHVLKESVTLSAIGGALGLLFAYIGVRALVAMRPDGIPRIDEIGIDPTILGFTALVSVVSGLVFGLFPALHHGATDLVTALKEGSRSATAGKERHRTRNTLVVTQVALALVLLVGSGLMIRSFRKLTEVDPGFQAEGVLTMNLALPGGRYEDVGAVFGFYDPLLERLEALPGVSGVGAATNLPLAGAGAFLATQIEDKPLAEGEFPPAFYIWRASPGFFRAMGMTLLEGELFDRWEHGMATGTGHVVVSRQMAESVWPGESPLGKRLGFRRTDSTWASIVGVVGGIRAQGLRETPDRAIYFPISDAQGGFTRGLRLTIRTTGDPMSLVSAVRQEVAALDPDLPIADIRPMTDIVGESMARVSFTTLLLTIGAAVSLLLGAVGIYGVISYIVSQRRTEIGLRIALGAQQRDVSRLVLKQGATLGGLGIVLGLAGAFGLTRLIGTTLLFEVSPTDPITYGVVALVFLGTVLVASLVPARRATRVSPLEALREQ